MGGGASCVGGYVPRGGVATALHGAVREGLAELVEETDKLGGLPGFIVKELHAYLRCGDLAYGFVRVRCAECDEELRVGFSCKGRTVCPSCAGRRAAVTAAHLVDEVLPGVPFRQWTLAFPRALRLVLAMDGRLLSAALGAFVGAIFALQRRHARRLGVGEPRPGAVAFLQNFTSALLLHPHFHVLVADGVFEVAGSDFVALPPVTDEEVERLLRRVARRVWKQARARYPDGLPYAEDARVALAAASAQTRLPLGEEGTPVKRRRCAFLEGFSLHADTWVHANDRQSLERLCRYGARGPLALERLTRREDGRLEYRLKKPSHGGATTLVLTPVQLLKRVCALVVKPRLHLTRYFGVFAPHASARAQVVPSGKEPAEPATTPEQLSLDGDLRVPTRARPRLDWAQLLRRTWGFDVFDCPCGGRRRVLALVRSPAIARKILGLPLRDAVPPRSTGPPQLSLALT